MTTYLLDRDHAGRIVARLTRAGAHPRAQAAGRALADALIADAGAWGASAELTLPDEHWPWIIGATA